MVYFDFPTGDCDGWGIVGDNLAAAIGRRAVVKRVLRRPAQLPLAAPLLQRVTSRLQPNHTGLRAVRRVGYAVFENDMWVRRVAVQALEDFDAIASACKWCEDALRDGGLHRVFNIAHGVDGSRFNPKLASRRRWPDQFVVLSGGKFEFRKGQDAALKAFQVFAERHSDVILVAAWHNPFPASIATMSASPYWPIKSDPSDTVESTIQRWLQQIGIDRSRIILVPGSPNADLATVYGDSDVGLFPSRCEGATNLMLMEYMACGRPAIVTDFSGHRDIASSKNSFLLSASKPLLVSDGRDLIGCWCEPDVEEILECLEYAYRHREDLKVLGRQAADDMTAFTWDRAAEKFLTLLGTSAID